MTVVDTRSNAARTAGTLIRSGTDLLGLRILPALTLAVVICAGGVAWATLLGASTDRPTPVSFVLAAVVSSLTARRRELRKLLVALPLLWILLAAVAGFVQVEQQASALTPVDVATAFGSVTVLEAPWLYLGVGLAFLLAAGRRGLRPQ